MIYHKNVEGSQFGDQLLHKMHRTTWVTTTECDNIEVKAEIIWIPGGSKNCSIC